MAATTNPWAGPRADEAEKAVGEVVSRAWAEPDFKARLLERPAEVFSEHGLELAGGAELRAVESTPNVVYLMLPEKPSEDLSDDALENVSGGASAGSAGTVGTFGSASTCLGTASTVGSAGTFG